MRTPRRVILLLTIAFGVSGIACSDDDQPGIATPALTSASDAPLADRACPGRGGAAPVFCADTSGMEAASVVKVIDGDTLDVTLAGREERIRIFGIDTPERGDRCFSEATALLKALAWHELRVLTDARKVDRNGRLLRYVYQPGGLSIDAAMIAAGAAHAWTRDGALRDPLVALEAEARDNRIGCLWSG